MKSKHKLNPLFRIVVLALALVIVAVAAAIGLYYYIFGISEPEGLSLAWWPHTFTENFSIWMENEEGSLKIEGIAIDRLDEYGLWLQVIDEGGQEVFAHSKPESYPTSYSVSGLFELSTSTCEQGNTVFVNSFEEDGKSWNYMIGFPYAIGKHVLYYNGENVARLSPVFRVAIVSLLCAAALFVLAYGFWLTRQLGKITKGIGDISLRSYVTLPEKGIFSEIYRELNKMNAEIRYSDKVQKETEQSRQEWIANITHDLKTPLSPIKGYAELLAGNPLPEQKMVQEYGEIILKNADHTEKLINDLKLTYQLGSGAMPYNPQTVEMIRYLRELIIDIANDPVFRDRDITFESNAEKITVCLDGGLFRRAIQNLIVNALTHNPPETKVDIVVNADLQKGIFVYIRDNGAGIGDTEQENLWDRYYRGTNTKEKTEGSGLGLAIAKQIVTLHGGDITVKSKAGEGTQFTVYLPSSA